MSIRIPPAARRVVFWDAVIQADPTNSTVTLEVRTESTGVVVAGSPFAMTWQGTAVHVAASATAHEYWTQTARTNVKFCGSTATVGSDVQLTAGVYLCRFLVAPTDLQVIPDEQFRMVVQ